ncbi:PBP1A family penicillin-binding protein [Cupriavidus metallidurans]|uniref:peptidoglycan glycosyltransferase n=2 Tax=Burkholderiaceae TaxID=119060 RepID=A0A482ITG2_9BURK|nr:PBP1A family penicillin-binding protein [Cupriavidus metallidurans]KWR82064.1 penicillin-binding protein [Cupriavidus sp. SHE]QBP10324.1 PBP1A family penicillin-binding protein [Cupriavidus metallidurans]QWC87398.1 PBP1A family penicillin-binding protein [Cupriavidus metallidurans]
MPTESKPETTSTPGRARIATCLGALAGLLIALGMAFGAWRVYQTWLSLPDVNSLAAFKPDRPLRIYSQDGILLAEYGDERREIVPLSRIPIVVQQSLLAIEDARFYEHGGVDFSGLFRAAWANFASGRHAQGASTITMQVARRLYLSSEKTYDRKLREVLLAFKLEQQFSKQRLLEVYMNQIYLGERAYGFAAAASIYFDKSLDQLTPAEAALLAGLPKAPSAFNPTVNPERARVRQRYILARMHELGYLGDEQYASALDEPLRLKPRSYAIDPAFAFPVERARQLVVDQYGERAYRDGLDVTLTIQTATQAAAYDALHDGLLRAQQRRRYIPLGRVAIDGNAPASGLDDYPDRDGLTTAVVTATADRGGRLTVKTRDGTTLRAQAPAYAATPLTRGTVVTMASLGGKWEIAQAPDMEGALVSIDSVSGDVVAWVGGYDFHRGKFDHAVQALRQPGSCFKPFVYSASLEKGYFPGTMVDDSQRVLDSTVTGARPWRPKNYGGRYDGFITAREGLVRSKNLVTVGLTQASGIDYVRDFALRFGFAPDLNPGSFPLALGAGSVTPMQLTQAYAVFSNGGYLVQPRLIARIVQRGDQERYTSAGDIERKQIISPRNAFIMDSLLRDVVRKGTGRAAARIDKADAAGKTGTSNDARDAWFAGYATGLATTVWVGHDQFRSLGAVTGGTLALPIWTDFMRHATADRAPISRALPDDVVEENGDYIYREYRSSACVSDSHAFIRTGYRCASEPAPVPTREQQREHEQILEWFRQDADNV